MYWGSLFLNLELNESLVFVFDTVEQQHSEKKDKFSFGWLKAVTQTGLKHYSQFILSLVCAKFAQTSCTFRWFLPAYPLHLCWFGNLLPTKFTICVGLVMNSPCLMSTCIWLLNIPLSDRHYATTMILWNGKPSKSWNTPKASHCILERTIFQQKWAKNFTSIM